MDLFSRPEKKGHTGAKKKIRGPKRGLKKRVQLT